MSKLVVQCRGRILRKRRRRAIHGWYLWTRARQTNKNDMAIASKHYNLRLLLVGSTACSSTACSSTVCSSTSGSLISGRRRRSAVLDRWHTLSEQTICRRKVVDGFLRRKCLKYWKKRTVSKTEARLGERYICFSQNTILFLILICSFMLCVFS